MDKELFNAILETDIFFESFVNKYNVSIRNKAIANSKSGKLSIPLSVLFTTLGIFTIAFGGKYLIRSGLDGVSVKRNKAKYTYLVKAAERDPELSRLANKISLLAKEADAKSSSKSAKKNISRQIKVLFRQYNKLLKAKMDIWKDTKNLDTDPDNIFEYTNNGKDSVADNLQVVVQNKPSITNAPLDSDDTYDDEEDDYDDEDDEIEFDYFEDLLDEADREDDYDKIEREAEKSFSTPVYISYAQVGKPLFLPSGKLHITNEDLSKNKPVGAFWGSHTKEHRDSWYQHIERSHKAGDWGVKLDTNRYVTFTIKKNAKVYVIDSLESFKKLPKVDLNAHYNTNIYKIPLYNYIDWEALSKVYDVVIVDYEKVANNPNIRELTDNTGNNAFWAYDCFSVIVFNMNAIDIIEKHQ